MNNLKFYKDGQSKIRSQKAIHNSIKKIYRDAAKEIQKEIDNLPDYQQHGEHINRRRLAQLQEQVNAIIDNIGTLEEEIIKDNLYTVADNTIGAQKEWLQEFGFKEDALDIAFSNIPQRMVEKMASGQIYEGGWNLSDSIWQDKRGIKVDLYTIVAQGLVQQDGILEIAQRLERYVNPNKLTMWNLTMTDGRKIFRKKVDYNSQRLARTLVQHGYQQNVIDSTKDNPFINHWVWRATGSRACDICQKLDGTVYTDAEDIPMDHPNGMCTIEVADDPNMVDKLADWINGEQGDFPEIDAFAETLGYTGNNVHDIIDVDKVTPLPRSYKNVIRNADERLEDILFNEGLVSVEANDEFRAEMLNLIDKNHLGTKVPDLDILDSILDTHFKSQFETGTSAGLNHPGKRKEMTSKLFGLSENEAYALNPDEFEKYGYLISNDFKEELMGFNATSHYGDVIITFKKETMNRRTTFTLGDSLNQTPGDVVGVPITDPSIAAHSKFYLKMDADPDTLIGRMNKDIRDNMNDPGRAMHLSGFEYAELQFHGEITAADIDTVVFNQRSMDIVHGEDRVDEIVEKLNKLGINVEVIGE